MRASSHSHVGGSESRGEEGVAMTNRKNGTTAAQRQWIQKLVGLTAVAHDDPQPEGAADLVELTISPEAGRLEFGGKLQYKATGKPADGPPRDLTREVVWSSDDRAVVSIGANNGLAAALGAGSTTIQARLERGIDGDLVAAAAVTVVSGPAPVRLIAISVTPERVTLKSGEGKQLQALGKFSNGKSEDVTTDVLWISLGPEVEVGNRGGFATAKPVAGEKTVTVLARHPEDPGTFGSAAVVVRGNQVPPPNRPVLKSITLRPPDPTGVVGNMFLFLADGRFADGSQRDVTKEVVFSSSDTSVLRFGGANVAKAESAGTVRVTARDAATGVTGTTGVTVKPGDTPPAKRFVSHVTVTNDSQVVLHRAKDEVLRGTYETAPPASIRPGATVAFSLDSGTADATSGFVRWEAEGVPEESWTITYGYTGASNKGDADQEVQGARFRAAAPVVREKDFVFALAQGQTPPPPQPQQQVAVSCLITVVNETQSVLTLVDPDNDRGEFFTHPQDTLKPGESTQFAYVQTPRETEPEKLGCKGSVSWELSPPASGVWICKWVNLVAERNQAAGQVSTGEEVVQSLAEAGQGDENVPFRFVLRSRAR
jgi:hypothetical protein